MKKSVRVISLILLACMLCITAVGCQPQDGGSDKVIKSLTANEESVAMKVGDSVLLTNCYEIKGNSALSAAQRACKYESSNPEVAKINGKRVEAVAPGTATITVTSNVDNTMTCTFDVVVAKVFIDRELTFISSDDDFTNEWDDAKGTGSFRTSGGVTNFFYIADINSTKWYVETEIKLHRVTNEDRWPKVGIFASSKDSMDNETMVTFYLNASIGLNDTYDEGGNLIKGNDNNVWNDFGVCEVSKGQHWAWEKGITDGIARHHDYAWNTGNTKFTFDTMFVLGVARDGENFHVYVNGQYMGSFKLNTTMGILAENGQVLPSHVGFWHFNSDATFSNYKATQDEAEVAKKIPASPKYIEEFNVDNQ